MILEVAILNVKNGETEDFERDFATASAHMAATLGYISHSLQRCLEQQNQYILLVQWETLESHTVGFRQSAAYQEWRRLLHHYYDPFPKVEHYDMVYSNKTVS